MSGIQVSEFDTDVAEYAQLQKNTVETFVHGVIKLGEVLSRQRDKWKPKGQWMEYLKKIGISDNHALKQISTYTYSLDHVDVLLKTNAQNFQQLYKFLSLPDEDKKELAEKIDGEELSTEEFNEKAKGEEQEVEVKDSVEQALEIVDPKALDFSGMIKSAGMTDIPFMAKKVMENMNKHDEFNFSKKSLPIIESFLHTQQAFILMQENIMKLSPEEQKYWTGQMAMQVAQLSKLAIITIDNTDEENV